MKQEHSCMYKDDRGLERSILIISLRRAYLPVQT